MENIKSVLENTNLKRKYLTLVDHLKLDLSAIWLVEN